MSIQENWEKALKKTEVIRPRVMPLHTFATTHVPYVFLAESAVNTGDTVVRKGEIAIERPAIILPPNMPQFDGFEFDDEASHLNEEFLKSFFLVRGVTFPSYKYNNKTQSVDIYEGRLSQAIEHYLGSHARDENTHSGLISGPEDVWQLSVLIFVCGQVARSADGDVRRLMDDLRRRGEMS